MAGQQETGGLVPNNKTNQYLVSHPTAAKSKRYEGRMGEGEAQVMGVELSVPGSATEIQLDRV